MKKPLRDKRSKTGSVQCVPNVPSKAAGQHALCILVTRGCDLGVSYVERHSVPHSLCGKSFVIFSLLEESVQSCLQRKSRLEIFLNLDELEEWSQFCILNYFGGYD